MKKDTNLLNTQDVRAEAATALTPNATNGEKIKALRTAQGMSMAELSRRASMSDRAIRYIEAGEREPSVDAIQKIAAALGVTTDYFMDDTGFATLDEIAQVAGIEKNFVDFKLNILTAKGYQLPAVPELKSNFLKDSMKNCSKSYD